MHQTTHIPKSVGVIIDGNRRWAKANGLPVKEGHRRGYNRLVDFITWARDAGITTCLAYVFSTENWNRSTEEVTNLMALMRYVLQNEIKKFKKENVRVVVVGQRERLDADIQELIAHAEEETRSCDGITAVLCVSYGGRAELVAAAQQLLDANTQTVTEAAFNDALWTGGFREPDLIIRTGGEQRLSNFLPWQSVYSELFFTDTLWPDFSREEFKSILDAYRKREQRRGR